MDVVVLTHHAKYEGSINVSHLPQAPRLQDMLNTPTMFNATSGGVPTNQIFLHNAKVTYKANGEVLKEEKPALLVFPDIAEIVYEITHTFSTGQGLAVYERNKMPREQAHISILTTGKRKLTGVLQLGLRLVTHPPVDKHFFALTDVELEEYDPEPVKTLINVVLINYQHVESVLFLEKPTP
ncbi:TPA: hypothetical protein DDW35_07930 [Candidatus Sumerlaeota bacterium]|jgi:hypothetical protein|nr:hypothetical protein [Candidatus Sumerlaeota bacterium]